MFIIKHRAIFFAIAGLLVGASAIAVAVFGIRPSIEFTGGTLIEIGYVDGRADKTALEEKIDTLNLGAYSLRPFGEDAYLLRVRELTVEERTAVMSVATLGGTAKPELRRQNTVGPTIGGELQNKAIAALGVIILMTIIYVAFAFRHVSEPVSSWKYGLIAIITLVHDVAIPIGVFAVAGHYLGTAEADILFVTALLTILGYSVNDTIVIFDRVRENLKKNMDDGVEEDFEVAVGRSLEQTFVRSFNTSVTVLIVVVAILLFGGSATFYFALALTAGVIAGTYSSLFLAAPLLVVANNIRKSDTAVLSGERKKKGK
ncbi:MAG: protein translocase subunit SecF [Candidatus Pacebacteria bacterium]|nr:protein translocase subunit SecF [Candidatus Paceibacterota bacterium]